MLVKACAISWIEVIVIAWHEHGPVSVVHQTEDVIVQRVRIVQGNVLDVTHSAIVELRTEILHIRPAAEVRVYLVVILHPITVISRAVTGPAFIHANVLRQRRDPDRRSAEALQVIELLDNALNVATPVFPELLFLCATLRETIDGVGGIRIHRIHVWIVRVLRIETIGEQEVDRSRAIIRSSLRGSGGGLRRVREYGDRKYRANKYCNCVSDSRSHKGGCWKASKSMEYRAECYRFLKRGCIHTAALQPRQMNGRHHATGAPATKFNRREFKRHEPRVVGQRFTLFLSQCSSCAAGKHQQLLATFIL